MDREDAVLADRGPGFLEGLPAGDELARPFGQEQCGVALVEMPDRRGQPKGAEGSHATDPEDDLLVQAHLAPTDVQDVGDRTIGVGVLRPVRVEQQHRDPADLGKPHGHGQVASRQLDGDRQRQAGAVLYPAQRQPAKVVVRVVVLLVPVGVDRLAEVALAIEQPHADRGERHVAGRLHVVAGQHPKAARVDPERLVEPVLGAEVGDRAAQLPAVAALEPVVRAVDHVLVERGQHVVVFGQELLVAQQPRPVGRTG